MNAIKSHLNTLMNLGTVWAGIGNNVVDNSPFQFGAVALNFLTKTNWAADSTKAFLVTGFPSQYYEIGGGVKAGGDDCLVVLGAPAAGGPPAPFTRKLMISVMVRGNNHVAGAPGTPVDWYPFQVTAGLALVLAEAFSSDRFGATEIAAAEISAPAVAASAFVYNAADLLTFTVTKNGRVYTFVSRD